MFFKEKSKHWMMNKLLCNNYMTMIYTTPVHTIKDRDYFKMRSQDRVIRTLTLPDCIVQYCIQYCTVLYSILYCTVYSGNFVRVGLVTLLRNAGGVQYRSLIRCTPLYCTLYTVPYQGQLKLLFLPKLPKPSISQFPKRIILLIWKLN